MNSTSALAEWENPCPTNDVINQFRVTVELQQSLSGNGNEVCEGFIPEENSYFVNETTLMVDNLQANLYYNLTVTAIGSETSFGDIEYNLFQQPPSGELCNH